MNNETKGKAMSHTLTPGFTVIDRQSTPSGYYQISFRHQDGRTVVSTQAGRGGANVTVGVGGVLPAFDEWLASNAALAIHWFEQIRFPDLAATIRERDVEWQDMIIGAILDLVEVGVLSVEG